MFSTFNLFFPWVFNVKSIQAVSVNTQYFIDYISSGGVVTYYNDVNKLVNVTNNGTMGTEGLSYTGRAINLGVDNSIKIPIHCDLGTELHNGNVIGNTYPATAITNGYNIVSDGSGKDSRLSASIKVYSDSTINDIFTIVFEFDAVIRSGSLAFNGYYLGGGSVNYFDTSISVKNGHNKIEIATRTGTTVLAHLYYNASIAFDIDITNISVKQVVSNTNSFITYYDFSTNTFIQLDLSTQPPSSTYSINSAKVNNILTHSQPFDLTPLSTNPNLLAKLGVSSGVYSISELNATLAIDDEFYACAEPTGDTIYGARNRTTVSITNYTPTIRETQQQAGLQTSCLILDTNGMPTSYTDNEIAIYDDAYIDTMWDASPEYIVEQGFFDGTNYIFSAYHSDGTKYTDGNSDGTFTTKLLPAQINNESFDGTPLERINTFRIINDPTSISNYNPMNAYNTWYSGL